MLQTEDTRVEKYSEYRLGTFLLCPRKYYYTYVDKKKTTFAKTPYFMLGGNVHEACKDFYRLRAEERTEENLYGLFRRIWKKNNAKSFFESVDEEREFGTRGLQMLANFYKRYAHRKPFIVERYLENRFDSFILFGRVDRVDVNEDESLEIVDYKTTRFYEAPEEDRMRRTLQLRIYALLLNSKRRPVMKGVFYHMPDDSFDEVEFSPETIAYFKAFVEDLIADIENETAFEEKRGGQCKFCDFGTLCFGDQALPETNEPEERDL